MHLLWFIFSTTCTGKGHEYQSYLSEGIDYTFVPSTKSEVKCTENLGHVMMKARG